MSELTRNLLSFDAQAPLLFTGGQFLFWFSLFLPGLWLLRRTGHGRLVSLALPLAVLWLTPQP